MNNLEKTLILFPEDPSTVFLEGILSYLNLKIEKSLFDIFKILPDRESYKKALNTIKDSEYNTIIFLGHGSSICLYGGTNNEYDDKAFIISKNFDVFNSKELILVACDSASFLKRNKKNSFKQAIGFGDLPSDWNDVLTAREQDIGAYKGFTEETIGQFRTCLVDIFKFSIADFLSSKSTLMEFFNLVLLRINKRIANYYTNDRLSNIPLSDTLLKMKSEATIIDGLK